MKPNARFPSNRGEGGGSAVGDYRKRLPRRVANPARVRGSGARDDGLIRSFFARFQKIDDSSTSMSANTGSFDAATRAAGGRLRPRPPGATLMRLFGLRSRLRPGRPAGLLRPELCGRRRRGAGGHRPQRRRQVVAAAAGRRPGPAGRRPARARGRRPRAHASASRPIISATRTRSSPRSRWPRTSPSGRASSAADAGDAALRATRRGACAPGDRRPGRPRPPARQLSLGRAAPAAVDRAADRGRRGRSGCSTSRPPRSTPPRRRCWPSSCARTSPAAG